MGNSCFCRSNNYIIDLNVESTKKSLNISSKQNLIKKEEKNYHQNFNGILKYFNENEKEILSEFKKEQKKFLTKKKNTKFETIINANTYELMLKRLLAQKEKKRCGPKRRETIRNGDAMKELVNEVIKMNNSEEKKPKKVEQENTHKFKYGSIIIQNKNNKVKKGRLSISLNRNDNLTGHICNNKNNSNI